MKIGDNYNNDSKKPREFILHEACAGFVCFKSFAASFLVMLSIDPGKGSLNLAVALHTQGFPGGSEGKFRLQCGRPGFDPWVGKIP